MNNVIRNFIYWFIAIIIGAFIAYTLLYLFKPEIIKSSQRNHTSILFDSLEANIGSLFLHQPGEIIFTFKNSGKHPLIIYNVRTTCGCTSPEWSGKAIKPGNLGFVKVTYDAESLGYFRKNIYVYANIDKNPVNLVIVGEVKSD